MEKRKKKKRNKGSVTLNQNIYPKLLEEVDMKKKKRKESVKSKRIQNFSSQEVDMKIKKKKKESITLNYKRYREGVRDVKLYIYIYIYIYMS